MKVVSSWLIEWTASILRHPRFFIMTPIIVVFLVAYQTIYDVTLRPLNAHLLTILGKGEIKSYFAFVPDHLWEPKLAGDVHSYAISKLTFRSSNTISYCALKEIHDFYISLPPDYLVFGPFPNLAGALNDSGASAEAESQIERSVLEALNLETRKELIPLFFNQLETKNHIIYSTHEIHAFILSQAKELELPPFVSSDISLDSVFTSTESSAAQKFLSYYNALTNHKFGTSAYSIFCEMIQVVFLASYLLLVYLAICNNHKIRSSSGLMIGWITEILVSAFASISILSRLGLSQVWLSTSGPVNWNCFWSYLSFIALLSSRNLFRVINDLAGDNTFGDHESVHKRLLRFYLGVNCSRENSRGVFFLSNMIRRILRLESLPFIVPLANTSIILLINVAGLSAFCFLCSLLYYAALPKSKWLLFFDIIVDYHNLTLLALAIDHILQLTYLIGITVIDLNRVDLTDMLEKSNGESEDENCHEMNPVSAKFLGQKITGSNSLRHRLGVFFLKVSPVSSKFFWLVMIPLMCGFACFIIAIDAISQKHTIEEYFFIQPLSISKSYDVLFWCEALAVLVLIVAISELVFKLTYFKRQKYQLDSSLAATLISANSDISLSELAASEDTKIFGTITLSEPSRAHKIKLYANAKAPILVSTDLNHKVLLWNPLDKLDSHPHDISTTFETSDKSKEPVNFWPVNHIEISDDGDHIVLINNRTCRIKCFERHSNKYIWEISLTSELVYRKEKMKPVLCFFRKRTVAGFLARKLLSRQHRQKERRNSNSSIMSKVMHGNFPPPKLDNESTTESVKADDYDKLLHEEEFVMILESGEMIIVTCNRVKIKVTNIIDQISQRNSRDYDLSIVASKLVTTARVNDRIVCVLSNNEIVVGTAVNNLWRFNELEIRENFYVNPLVAYAPPMMSRGGSHVTVGGQSFVIPKHEPVTQSESALVSKSDCIIATIDFVGMFVRVNNLRAELIDIQSGTILKVFNVGSFKPKTFKVSHSEPTHCKFCGSTSFESISLLYEDYYSKTLIVHTYKLENKKSRNNICLRVERDPREIRCLGLDSVVESQFWYEDVEQWELTDMNVVIGVKKTIPLDESLYSHKRSNKFESFETSSQGSLKSLKNRRQQKNKANPPSDFSSKNGLWQGFVVIVQNGKILEYKISTDTDVMKAGDTRPNYIVKFGFKAVAIALGGTIKIMYLGNDDLIESDLYYSGSTSTLSPIFRTSSEEPESQNELLFINKRRKIIEGRLSRSNMRAS